MELHTFMPGPTDTLEIKWLGHIAQCVNNTTYNRWDLFIDDEPVKVSRYHASFIWDVAGIAIDLIQRAGQKDGSDL